MKTGRFGGQPERPVFSVWVLTGFACCSARKSRSTHAVFRKCSYSAGFTLNTYTHATAQMKQDAADTIGGVISQQMR